MTEKQFENKIKVYLKALPRTWFFKVWGGGFQQAGIPDILGCINGRFLAIEVKAENGRSTPLQERNIRLINEAGGLGVILYPKDWEAYKTKLEAFTWVHKIIKE